MNTTVDIFLDLPAAKGERLYMRRHFRGPKNNKAEGLFWGLRQLTKAAKKRGDTQECVQLAFMKAQLAAFVAEAQVAAEQKGEVLELREILCEVLRALGNGLGVSPTATMQVLHSIPEDVRQTVELLREVTLGGAEHAAFFTDFEGSVVSDDGVAAVI